MARSLQANGRSAGAPAPRKASKAGSKAATNGADTGKAHESRKRSRATDQQGKSAEKHAKSAATAARQRKRSGSAMPVGSDGKPGLAAQKAVKGKRKDKSSQSLKGKSPMSRSPNVLPPLQVGAQLLHPYHHSCCRSACAANALVTQW
jgi:hypothetical protein